MSSGVNDTTLGNWVKADRAERGVSDETGLLPLAAAERAELTRLRRQNARLKSEREILTQAVAFFARRSRRGGNRRRRHSALGHRSPADFEAAHIVSTAA